MVLNEVVLAQVYIKRDGNAEPVEVVGRPHHFSKMIQLGWAHSEHRLQGCGSLRSEHASKDSGVLWHSVLYLSTAGHKKQGELALLPKNVHESKECGYSSGRESTKGECEQVAKAVECFKG